MGTGWSGYVGLAGLVFLATLTAIGLVGALILVNNGREVPQWLSTIVGTLATNFGIIILFLFKGSGGSSDGVAGNGNGRRVADYSRENPTGIKAG